MSRKPWHKTPGRRRKLPVIEGGIRLGEVSDADAAYLLRKQGDTPTTPGGVTRLRQRHGVPPYGSRED